MRRIRPPKSHFIVAVALDELAGRFMQAAVLLLDAEHVARRIGDDEVDLAVEGVALVLARSKNAVKDGVAVRQRAAEHGEALELWRMGAAERELCEVVGGELGHFSWSVDAFW
jgi:hypothetical protein